MTSASATRSTAPSGPCVELLINSFGDLCSFTLSLEDAKRLKRTLDLALEGME